jgi:hypothetical protein
VAQVHGCPLDGFDPPPSVGKRVACMQRDPVAHEVRSGQGHVPFQLDGEIPSRLPALLG